MTAAEALRTISAAFADLEGLAETITAFRGNEELEATEAEVRLAEYPDLDEAFGILQRLTELSDDFVQRMSEPLYRDSEEV